MKKIALALAVVTATLALNGCVGYVGVPYGPNYYYRPAPVYYAPPVYRAPYYGPYCCYR